METPGRATSEHRAPVPSAGAGPFLRRLPANLVLAHQTCGPVRVPPPATPTSGPTGPGPRSLRQGGGEGREEPRAGRLGVEGRDGGGQAGTGQKPVSLRGFHLPDTGGGSRPRSRGGKDRPRRLNYTGDGAQVPRPAGARTAPQARMRGRRSPRRHGLAAPCASRDPEHAAPDSTVRGSAPRPSRPRAPRERLISSKALSEPHAFQAHRVLGNQVLAARVGVGLLQAPSRRAPSTG